MQLYLSLVKLEHVLTTSVKRFYKIKKQAYVYKEDALAAQVVLM